MFSYKKRKCEMRQNVTRVTRMLSVYEVLFSYSFELVQPALICAGDVFNGSAFFYFLRTQPLPINLSKEPVGKNEKSFGYKSCMVFRMESPVFAASNVFLFVT